VKEESSEVAQVLQHNTGPYILKVKRKRDDEALDEICKFGLTNQSPLDLEYDLQGSIKRTKLVTEAETLQSRLS